jgi:hypothetical protein
MIEALQEELATKSSQLILYLQSARIHAILRDTTTIPPAANSRLVFLPESVYPYLIRRFISASENGAEAVGQYLVTRASDKFLLALDQTDSEVINRALSVIPEPDGNDVAPNLAVRITRVSGASLLNEERYATVDKALIESVIDNGWAGFLDVFATNTAFSVFIDVFLQSEIQDGFSSIKRLYHWYSQDLSSKDLVDYALDALETHTTRLQKALSRANLLSETIRTALVNAKDMGLSIPVVYNSSAYEKVEILKSLEGLVDIYLPDLKYFDNKFSIKYSKAPEYFKFASRAVLEMYRQVGNPVFDDDGMMKKGLMIRHLMLPGGLFDSKKIVDWVLENLPKDVYLNLMSQYTPMNTASEYPEIDKKLNQKHYDALVDYAVSNGLENGFIQESESATEENVPDFNMQGI